MAQAPRHRAGSRRRTQGEERLSGKPMPDPEPAPMTDVMIKQIAERFGANARPEDTATLDAKQLKFMKPLPGLRLFKSYG